MRILNIQTCLNIFLVSGGTGEIPGKITVTTTPRELNNNLVRPAGPVRPLPPHVDPDRPVWLGPDEGIGFWARRPAVPVPPNRLPFPPRPR